MNSPSSKYLYGRTSTFGTPLKTTKEEEDAIMAQLDPGPPVISKSYERRVAHMKAAKRAPLMPHAERRRLIEAPFTSTVHGSSTPWGGVYIRDSIPESGHRVFQAIPEDEEWCRTKWEDE